MKKEVVFVFVHNDGPNDSRVMKEAKALVEAGYDVHLFCKKMNPKQKDNELIDGLNVVRFDCWGLDELTDLSWFKNLDFLMDSKETVWKSTEALAELEKKRKSTCNKNLKTKKRSLWVKTKIAIVNFLRFVGLEEFFFYFYRRRENFTWRLLNKLFLVLNIKANWLRKFIIKPVSNNSLNHMYYAKYAIYYANIKKVKHDLKPVFIHCHDLYTLPAGIALSKSFGSKVIYDAHELETERVPPLPPERKKFICQLEDDCVKYASGIISVSPFLVNYYKERFVGPVNMVMNIPEHIEPESVPTLRERLNLSKNTPLVVYTGGVGGPYRGLHLVVKALRELPNFQLAILGPRNEGYDHWLMGYIKKYNVESQVHFIKPVPPTQVVNVIRDADIAICPIQDATLSYRYCLPNKLFEAIQAGVPVCASNLPEMSRVLNELKVGLVVDQTNPKSISEGMSSLFSKKEEYILKPDKKEYYEDNYSWSAQKMTLIKMYESLG